MSAHMLNLNQPLISHSARHWAVPVSYGPFRQRCPWGTWVSVLMTCHTIFITVTCLFMGTAHISEPTVGSAISLDSLFAAPPLWLFNYAYPDFSPHLTLLSLFFFHPLCPSVLVITLTLPLTLYTPDIIDSLLLLSHRPRHGGCIKVTDLASNWTQHGREVSCGWLCKTFDKWEIGWPVPAHIV